MTHYCIHIHAYGCFTLHNVCMFTHYISFVQQMLWGNLGYNTFRLCSDIETVSHFLKVNTKIITTICWPICNDKGLLRHEINPQSPG